MSDDPTAVHASFTDRSGKIHITIFEREAQNAQHHFKDFKVRVPDDMVAVGGGAEATDVPNGALLTMSRPSDNLTRWSASSKDHNVPNEHRLRVFAIGLKIDGVADMRDVVKVFSATGGIDHHPSMTAFVDNGFLLIGGGFFADWETLNPNGGSLGTASCPTEEGGRKGWFAQSKDHFVSSAAAMTSFAIGIRSVI